MYLVTPKATDSPTSSSLLAVHLTTSARVVSNFRSKVTNVGFCVDNQEGKLINGKTQIDTDKIKSVSIWVNHLTTKLWLIQRGRSKRRIKAQDRRKNGGSRSPSRHHPIVDGIDRSNQLRAREVAVAVAVCIGLEKRSRTS